MAASTVNHPADRQPSATALTLALAIEDDLAYARKLQDLAHWVGTARAMISDLQKGADDNPELERMLRKHDVAASTPDWGAHEDDGLFYLNMSISNHLRAVARTAHLDDGQQAAELDEALQ